MPRQLAQLPQGFKRVFNEGAAAFYEARLAFHADTERAFLVSSTECCLIQRRPAGESLAFRRADCGGANPFQFAGDGSIPLIRKSLKEETYFLSGNQFGHAGFMQQ